MGGKWTCWWFQCQKPWGQKSAGRLPSTCIEGHHATYKKKNQLREQWGNKNPMTWEHELQNTETTGFLFSISTLTAAFNAFNNIICPYPSQGGFLTDLKPSNWELSSSAKEEGFHTRHARTYLKWGNTGGGRISGKSSGNDLGKHQVNCDSQHLKRSVHSNTWNILNFHLLALGL